MLAPPRPAAARRPRRLPAAVAAILDTPIRELRLAIAGSPLERPIARLYRELRRGGLERFQPRCYLTDEWGCPSGEPIVGVPFYLADRRLSWLERELNDLENQREVMMYLRHEAGHAFNYAYRLHRTPEWRALFGPFRRPYRDHYRPVAFSREYVRHIAGWYAQKHPDEDFAETFAVWLTPSSRWREKYRTWGALRKLEYMDRIARQVGAVEPLRRRGRSDITADEMEMTVAEYFVRSADDAPPPAAEPPGGADAAAARAAASARLRELLSARVAPSPPLPTGALALDADLADIFNVSPRRRGARPAAALLGAHRKALTDKVTYWTGVQRPAVKKLLQSMEQRLAELGLAADAGREAEHLAELAAYATALALAQLARGAPPRDGRGAGAVR
ncbi:MAG TPA: putative zinc-binding metallopeptidase [Terriglobales bacterium]|nr:putative zinc-binding metallopeptidase [Terriglobales bacterium]